MAETTLTPLQTANAVDPEPGPLVLEDFDHLELSVGNSIQAAHYYRTAVGLVPTYFAGLETGMRNKSSVVMQQGNVSLVLTSALSSEDAVAQHVLRHGDGVTNIAFKVRDVWSAYHEALCRGAHPIADPEIFEDENGRIITAKIKGCGPLAHTLIQRTGEATPFLPGYRSIHHNAGEYHFKAIDHVACAVDQGTLDQWVEFYSRVFGFVVSHEESIVTGKTAMRSKVIQDPSGKIRFPLVEPAPAKQRSQVEEYLNYHGSSGVQHAAFLTSSIVSAVDDLKKNGVEWLRTPMTYYEALESRVGLLERENVDALRDLNILVDKDESGYLLQIFTRPLQSRPTFFLEVIQREGCRGFGSGNIRALFEAIEREQALRGTL
jgi:4-hydroxyphenylpyruvate dioxygenase